MGLKYWSGIHKKNENQYVKDLFLSKICFDDIYYKFVFLLY